MEQGVLGIGVAELAVRPVRHLLRGREPVMDVYRQAFSSQLSIPLVSLSYVFGILGAIAVFHEHVNCAKWAGVGLIILGCFIISKP